MPSEHTLLAAADRLVAAFQRHVREQSTDTADAVIAARLALQEAFIAAGWVPPRYRQEQMLRDRELLAERAGILDELIPQQSTDGSAT